MRPAIMIAESEPLEALSTRKLVLETAKFNVLTVHSKAEALECIAAFPNISAAVLVSEHKIACEEVAAAIRKSLPHLPIIVLTARIGYSCPGADYHLSSYKPEDLLDLLRKLFGDPRTREPSAE